MAEFGHTRVSYSSGKCIMGQKWPNFKQPNLRFLRHLELEPKTAQMQPTISNACATFQFWAKNGPSVSSAPYHA